MPGFFLLLFLVHVQALIITGDTAFSTIEPLDQSACSAFVLPVRLTNTTANDAALSLSLINAPDFLQSQFSTAAPSIGAGQSYTLDWALNIPCDAPAGNYSFQIQSQAPRSDRVSRVDVRLRVFDPFDIRLNAPPQTACIEERLQYTFSIDNNSSQSQLLEFAVLGNESLKISPAQIDFAPGQTSTLTISSSGGWDNNTVRLEIYSPAQARRRVHSLPIQPRACQKLNLYSIQLNQQDYSSNIPVCQGSVAALRIRLSNAGTKPLVVQGDFNNLSATLVPKQSIINAGQTQQFIVSLNDTNSPIDGQIIFRSTQSPLVIPIQIATPDCEKISIDPSAIRLIADANAQRPLLTRLTISNQSPQAIRFKTDTPSGWIRVTPSDFSLGVDRNTTITIEINPPADYNGDPNVIIAFRTPRHTYATTISWAFNPPISPYPQTPDWNGLAGFLTLSHTSSLKLLTQWLPWLLLFILLWLFLVWVGLSFHSYATKRITPPAPTEKNDQPLFSTQTESASTITTQTTETIIYETDNQREQRLNNIKQLVTESKPPTHGPLPTVLAEKTIPPTSFAKNYLVQTTKAAKPQKPVLPKNGKRTKKTLLSKKTSKKAPN